MVDSVIAVHRPTENVADELGRKHTEENERLWRTFSYGVLLIVNVCIRPRPRQEGSCAVLVQRRMHRCLPSKFACM